MIVVVVDTNVLVRETHLLSKKGGPPLVRLLRATNGRLLIPEILHNECVKQSVAMASEGRRDIDAALTTLHSLLRVRLDNPYPKDEAVRAGALARLRSLENLTISDPLTSEIQVAAGNRIIAEKRPATKSDHGYKDCLIWESVLQLPSGSQALVISRDKAFFDRDNLHPELIAEAQERGIRVTGYKEIEEAIKELTDANPNLDLGTLEAQDLAEKIPEPIEEIIPPAPVPQPVETPSQFQSTTNAVDEIIQKLSEAQKPYNDLDLKVLAYIAYLDTPSKIELTDALADSGVEPDVTNNVAERLVLSGFVSDTGNRYLIKDRRVGDLIAPSVEKPIIAWLEKSRSRNGQ